ncbi:chromatin remodelling factor-like protein [Phlyctochytrium arcticum]|nr:chromatin remodelling factor-like protein [Phlyctochytrium arcticum]
MDFNGPADTNGSHEFPQDESYENDQDSDIPHTENNDMEVDAENVTGPLNENEDTVDTGVDHEGGRTEHDLDHAHHSAGHTERETAPNSDAGGIDGSGMNVRLAELESGPTTATKMLVPQAQEIIIPSYSAWFNMSRIHDIEKRSQQEFFNNKNKSKTPTVYKDYRDFMINTYRLNPSEYLTVTACRRNLAGDVCAIIRVHAFLEQWGLINYQVDADSRPSTVGPAFTGHFRVTADTPRGLQPLYPAAPLLKTEPKLPSRDDRTGHAGDLHDKSENSTSLRFTKNIYESAINPSRKHSIDAEVDESTTNPPAKRVKHNCATCGVDCSRQRYHNTKTPSMEICDNCYLEGRFPSNMYSGDFIRMEDRPTKQGSEDKWTEQETLLLLEGIELFDEDWNKVSEHVGTRTRDQCVLHFLQLPIEDPYVGAKTGDLGPLQFHRTPFSAADNPILSLTAFLASVVEPKVAAAAAKAAIEQLQPSTTMEKESTQEDGLASAKGHRAERRPTQSPGPKSEESESTGRTSGVQAIPISTEDEEASPKERTAEDANTGEQMEMDQEEPKEGGDASAGPEKRSDTNLQKAAAVAIASAGAKAHVIGGHATSELQALTLALIQTQIRKLDAKMHHFEEMESLLEDERKEIEREKQRLYMDRVAFRRTVLQWEARQAGQHLEQGSQHAEDIKGRSLGDFSSNGRASRVELLAHESSAATQDGENFLLSIG